MADKFVTEDLLKDAMNDLVSKEKFQSDIDRLIASVTDVNKTLTALATKLDEHIAKVDLDAGSFRLEQGRLNTKIDNVQTQLLEKQGRFDKAFSSGSGSSNGPPPAPVHKLRFPKYDGTKDTLNWLHKCEQFFRSQGTPPAQQVWTAAFYLEGAASQGYFRLEKNHDKPSWAEFVDGVNRRFGPPTWSNPLGELMHLRCSSSVAEYQEQFLTLLANERQQIAIFSTGLPTQMGIDVDLQKSATLDDAMGLARAFERLQLGEDAECSAPRHARAPPRSATPSAPAAKSPTTPFPSSASSTTPDARDTTQPRRPFHPPLAGDGPTPP
jgi:hypothetical protein